jgi:SAM-dependent methyltransferase
MTSGIVRKIAFYCSMGPRYCWWRLRAPFAPDRLRMRRHAKSFSGRGLEIGGPSESFATDGLFPVYAAAATIDNVTYSDKTHWEGEVQGGRTFRFHVAKDPGNQYVMEAGAVDGLLPATYDFIISSHMLEHAANPIATLRVWQRVLREEGLLLLILPHRDGSFDHRRPVTNLAHLLEDAKRAVSEDDQTHLEEILALHDLSRDPSQSSRAAFERWIGQNGVNRGAHHHVFDTRLAVQMLDAVGMQMIDVETAMPHHIVLLAKKIGAGIVPDNASFLARSASAYLNSPFESDQ